jgi:hypothetical protein
MITSDEKRAAFDARAREVRTTAVKHLLAR